MSLTTGETTVTLPNGLQRQVLYEACDAITSANDTLTAPAAWQFDISGFAIISASLIVATNTMAIGVWYANKSDFTDEKIAVSAQNLTAGTHFYLGGSTTGFNAATGGQAIGFRYVRFKYQTAGAGANGTMTLTFNAKNT